MFFIFIVNTLALKFYWYSSIWYLDIIMHFLGGLWLGIFFIYAYVRSARTNISIPYLLVFVFFIGLLWEFFELGVYNYIGGNAFDALDTFTDLCFDLVGGWVAYLLYVRLGYGK